MISTNLFPFKMVVKVLSTEFIFQFFSGANEIPTDELKIKCAKKT